MKNLYIVLALGLTLSFFGCSHHNKMKHQMGHEMGASGPTGGNAAPDERAELKLPPQMKLKQKLMMIKHLDTVGELLEALAQNRLEDAATVDIERLGWNPQEEEKCKKVSALSNEPDFLELGMAVHSSADELAEFALAGKRDLALGAMAELLRNCNACHKRFRH